MDVRQYIFGIMVAERSEKDLKNLERELTFVVQGPIDLKHTPRCIESIKRHFKKSRIILTTWDSEKDKVNNLPEIDFIFNEDPGAACDDLNGIKRDNINRQIVSSSAGLKITKSKYVIKTRTDIFFKNNNILKYYKEDLERDPNYKVFENFILQPNYNVKNPRKIDIVFHPGDLLLFGLTTDVRNYYDCRLRTVDESMYHKYNNSNDLKIYPNLLTRKTAEAYLWTEFLKEQKNVDIETCFSENEDLKNLSDKFLVSNFMIFNPFQLGVRFPKYPYREFKSYFSYTHKEWLSQYSKLVLGEKKNYFFDLENLIYKTSLTMKSVYDILRGKDSMEY